MGGSSPQQGQLLPETRDQEASAVSVMLSGIVRGK